MAYPQIISARCKGYKCCLACASHTQENDGDFFLLGSSFGLSSLTGAVLAIVFPGHSLIEPCWTGGLWREAVRESSACAPETVHVGVLTRDKCTHKPVRFGHGGAGSDVGSHLPGVWLGITSVHSPTPARHVVWRPTEACVDLVQWLAARQTPSKRICRVPNLQRYPKEFLGMTRPH